MFSTGHRLLAVCLFAASLFSISASAQQNCGPLVDSLGTFSISSTYSFFGAGALTVSRYQAVGPRIILDQPKVITEIGAMANSAFPLIVQIRPSLNGVPNPSAVIASFALSFDNDPYTFSYESVKPNLILPAGTYFVLFTTQTEEDIGGMLQTFPPYIADSFPAGTVNLNTGESRFSNGETGAARILACALATPTFDRCIQDESNGNILQINTTTGEYQFTNCAGLTVGGTGLLTRRGSLITLQHNATDRRVMAMLDSSTNRASASVQLYAQARTFSITDRNIANNTCACR